jgi:FMN phosphatase YigB (HAD superfamily)
VVPSIIGDLGTTALFENEIGLIRNKLMTKKVVFLFDVDNTLLDNDRIADDLKQHLEQEVGHDRQEQYWAIFEQLRVEVGYADYLGALQRYRLKYPRDLQVLTISYFLIEYPFGERLFANSIEVLERSKELGEAVILSDGDVVFQPHKIRRSGLFDAVNGNVLIYLHKEHELEDVKRRYPADQYILIDDKLRILTAVKRMWRENVTTVFPQQGHYAHDPEMLARYPAADLTIRQVGDLLSQVDNLVVR